jgi:predicted anti-sigma-YlaC factor YlaD
MNCKEAMNRILHLDNGQPCDHETAEHLNGCEGCRREYDRLNGIIANLRAVEARDGTLTDRIMEAVRKQKHVRSIVTSAEALSERRDYLTWILGGAIIVFGMMILPYTEVLTYLRNLPGSRIDATLAISLGLVLCVYIGLFIGTNLDRLTALFRRIT